eukprot:Rmarinus@m.28723
MYSAFFDRASSQMIRALGGLYGYLQARGLELPENSDHCLVVSDVDVISAHMYSTTMMKVDPPTYSALQIFQTEEHPSVYNLGPAKEGFSLFSLLNRSKSAVGRKMLRLWFLRPLVDETILHERQDAISALLQSQCYEHRERLSQTFRLVKDGPRIVTRLRMVQESIEDWQHLYKMVGCTIRTMEVLHDLRKTAPGVKIFQRLGEHVRLDELSSLLERIHATIHFEQSRENKRLVVHEGVDEDLDNLKAHYEGLPDFLNLVGKHEIVDLAKEGLHVSRLFVVYMPQFGYLLSLEESSDVSKVPSCQFQFEAEGKRYYKTPRMREMDDTLGDIFSVIMDMEEDIIRRLRAEVSSCAGSIIRASSVIAELDCLMALAEVASEQHWSRPTLTNSNVLELYDCTYPLQKSAVDKFIPNDVLSASSGLSDSEKKPMSVITGPNFSGKSVYLKQVGLAVFLAHIGSFVPAQRAVIGLTDAIFTRMRSQDSVTSGESTFLIDCGHVSRMLRQSTERSLLLIDEFGKGTLWTDGMAILLGVLRSLIDRRASCPKTFVTTHFFDSIREVLPEEELRWISERTMDVFKGQKDDVVYLYKLVPAKPHTSLATHCSLLAGVPSKVVRRAEEVSDSLRHGRPITINDTDVMSREDAIRQKRLVRILLESDFSQRNLASILRNV